MSHRTSTGPIPFVERHVGTSGGDRAKMLAALGYGSLDELVDAALPAGIRCPLDSTLPPAASEEEVFSELRALSESNRPGEAMIGLGYYGTVTPPVIRRNVLEDPSWYTAYTPYQPEISQGRLEALLNFQTMVSELTAMPVANASLLDEATAAVEAVGVIRRSSRRAAKLLLVDADTFPQTVAVLRTRCEAIGVEVAVFDPASGLPGETPAGPPAAGEGGGAPTHRADLGGGGEGASGAAGDRSLLGVLLQYPGASGAVRDDSALVDEVHGRGAMVVVAADPLALTLLRPPGEWGADVVIGSTQRFGVPLGYGGPHAAFIAVRQGLERHLPGRLVGVSVDAAGRPAYRLALQTREQHIRRDRATSNICTAQVLLAVIASMYAVYHGPEGLTAIARRVHQRAGEVASGLAAAGVPTLSDTYFDTVTARVPGRAAEVVARAAASPEQVHLRLVDADHVGIACGETTTAGHVAAVLRSFAGTGDSGAAGSADDDARSARTDPGHLADGTRTGDDARGEDPLDRFARTAPPLTHPVFERYRSETAMLRYLRRLSDRDYALDRGMIPLGSCTMKLNATAEMEPISYPGFAGVHPFVPAEAARGYEVLVAQLERWLAELTGYAKVSLQPNAGSQGELTGLLAIRAYHRDRGEAQRDVCLIPASAHGTNAASAVAAGLRVVVVATREDGSVDLDDLTARCEEHSDRLAAAMVTYPSTHGVYEAGIGELCRIVHHYKGQVYVDGANLNALVGLAEPGRFGGDVSHLNLHKTFCIPHGGGGPGVGPVAVADHLVPYLPTHPAHPDPGRRHGPVGPVAAAPYGSAGILPISWAYLRLMGPDGLALATKAAVLAANYLAARLGAYFPVLYSGNHGLVAHECILDLRALTKETGVSVDDVAKRLIDYGFHAPTMSFPVAGTLMVEPTESETLEELDRFCAAMIAIRAEIDEVAAGRGAVEDSPLRHAPHVAADLAGPWERSYDRMTGAYPAGVTPDKYWPPVGRVDQAYGDRHLVCSCPPPEVFVER